jgi:hypothetical protein
MQTNICTSDGSGAQSNERSTLCMTNGGIVNHRSITEHELLSPSFDDIIKRGVSMPS